MFLSFGSIITAGSKLPTCCSLTDTHASNSTVHGSYAFLARGSLRTKMKEFNITRENYAGHYIPRLANVVVEENKKALKENYINFKGINCCYAASRSSGNH